MKRILCTVLVLCHCVFCTGALAGGWTVPNNHGSSGSTSSESSYSARVQLVDDLATRSGPSTSYTGCGSYKMKGQYVTALTRAYDGGGVMWVEIEFSYGGGYRRAWTGAKRLDISANQLKNLPEQDAMSYIGYGTVNTRVAPRFGPDSIYSTYGDRDYRKGDRVAVIASENGYYMVESYHTDGSILRSWIPSSNVNLD